MDSLLVSDDGLACCVCDEGINSGTELSSCKKCNIQCHYLCGKLENGIFLCQICQTEQNSKSNQDESFINQEKAAKAMVYCSNSKLNVFSIGDMVLFNIPQVDRGPMDFRNLNAKMMEEKRGMYKIGTEHGIIENYITRNQLPPSWIYDNINPPDISISVRKAVTMASSFGGQGYFKCSCKTNCITKNCKCEKAFKVCGSRCHPGITCCNK